MAQVVLDRGRVLPVVGQRRELVAPTVASGELSNRFKGNAAVWQFGCCKFSQRRPMPAATPRPLGRAASVPSGSMQSTIL